MRYWNTDFISFYGREFCSNRVMVISYTIPRPILFHQRSFIVAFLPWSILSLFLSKIS